MAVLHQIDSEELAARTQQTLSATPRPFLRWAGSKQRLLRQIAPLLPASFNRYYEPFLGGGSLFFCLAPRVATLSDAASELVATYRTVAWRTEEVLKHLAVLDPLDKTQYYRVRAHRSKSASQRAAQFIYLNRAGWNGLYRVNSNGDFNVPYGAPKTSNLVDPTNLRACAKCLRRSQVSLACGDFSAVLKDCAEGDLVFLDPPYVTGHNNNGFIDYNESIFSWSDQERLAETARALAVRGVHVLVTNAHHDAVLELYPDFEIHLLKRASTLAASVDSRREVREVLLRPSS